MLVSYMWFINISFVELVSVVEELNLGWGDSLEIECLLVCIGFTYFILCRKKRKVSKN